MQIQSCFYNYNTNPILKSNATKQHLYKKLSSTIQDDHPDKENFLFFMWGLSEWQCRILLQVFDCLEKEEVCCFTNILLYMFSNNGTQSVLLEAQPRHIILLIIHFFILHGCEFVLLEKFAKFFTNSFLSENLDTWSEKNKMWNDFLCHYVCVDQYQSDLRPNLAKLSPDQFNAIMPIFSSCFLQKEASWFVFIASEFLPGQLIELREMLADEKTDNALASFFINMKKLPSLDETVLWVKIFLYLFPRGISLFLLELNQSLLVSTNGIVQESGLLVKRKRILCKMSLDHEEEAMERLLTSMHITKQDFQSWMVEFKQGGGAQMIVSKPTWISKQKVTTEYNDLRKKAQDLRKHSRASVTNILNQLKPLAQKNKIQISAAMINHWIYKDKEYKKSQYRYDPLFKREVVALISEEKGLNPRTLSILLKTALVQFQEHGELDRTTGTPPTLLDKKVNTLVRSLAKNNAGSPSLMTICRWYNKK